MVLVDIRGLKIHTASKKLSKSFQEAENYGRSRVEHGIERRNLRNKLYCNLSDLNGNLPRVHIALGLESKPNTTRIMPLLTETNYMESSATARAAV